MTGGLEVLENTQNSVSVKVSRETYDALNEERERIRRETGRKRTFQELLDQSWNDRPAADGQRKKQRAYPEVPEEYAPCMKKLAEILSSGDEPIIRAAVSNLEVFHDRLRPVGRKGR